MAEFLVELAFGLAAVLWGYSMGLVDGKRRKGK